MSLSLSKVTSGFSEVSKPWLPWISCPLLQGQEPFRELIKDTQLSSAASGILAKMKREGKKKKKKPF